MTATSTPATGRPTQTPRPCAVSAAVSPRISAEPITATGRDLGRAVGGEDLRRRLEHLESGTGSARARARPPT